MTLRDEIVADSPYRNTECSVCAWLRNRPDIDEWADVMFDHTLTHTAIARAMQARGYAHSDKPVETHRNRGHDPRVA